MEEFRKWRIRTIWLIACTIAVSFGVIYFESISNVIRPITIGLLLGLIISSFISHCFACLARCSKCGQAIVSTSHFWSGTEIFINPTKCKGCGSEV